MTTTYNPETVPVEESKRLLASEIKIEIASEQDAHKIAEGLFVCYPDSSIDTIQPPHLRPQNYKQIRVQRLAKSSLPTFSTPGITWLKAVHVPTNTIIGAACWTGPDAPIVCPFRRDAFTLYGWQERLGWSDEEIDELFAHCDHDLGTERHQRDDKVRKEMLGDEKHWYLALLLTWPEWQGRGVGRRLLDWGIERADKEDTVMYLETSAKGKNVYEHVGFVVQGEGKVMIRRGRKAVAGS
ncbi:hypothetical protein SLS61_008505 [Didymella pomorum]